MIKEIPMKAKIISVCSMLLSLIFVSLSGHEIAKVDAPKATTNHNSSNLNERYEVMQEDEVDGTDVLAIPFDDSNVEDEELIDELEGKPFTPSVPTKNAPSSEKK